jgi:DNA processing protein
MIGVSMRENAGEKQVAYVYWISYFSHLGERAALKFKQSFPTYDSYSRLSPTERVDSTNRVLGESANSILTTNFDALMDHALNDIRDHQRQGIHVFSIDSPEYPEMLRQIPDPPLILFVKGSINGLSDSLNIAVIGTRNATQAGEKVAFKIAKWFGEHNWCVVSGLAKGIDSAAHKGALNSHSQTAAVMATPLNKVYPAENRALANDILDHGGCWISELPLWKRPHRGAFVQRDRIQSGMSVAVFPVQTDIEGGTMHTVRYAEQQDRLIFCPRPIEIERSAKQYVGIRSLIENRRAVPFSGDEYDRVLQSLVQRRNALLQAAPQSSRIDRIENRVESALEVQTPTEIVEEVKPPGDSKRKKRNRQVGFGFIEEPSAKARKKTITKKQADIRLKFFEELREDIADARRPDGGKVFILQDVIEWLEQKIEDLRRETLQS